MRLTQYDKDIILEGLDRLLQIQYISKGVYTTISNKIEEVI